MYLDRCVAEYDLAPGYFDTIGRQVKTAFQKDDREVVWYSKADVKRIIEVMNNKCADALPKEAWLAKQAGT